MKTIAIIIVVAVLGGIGYYVMTSRGDAQPGSGTEMVAQGDESAMPVAAAPTYRCFRTVPRSAPVEGETITSYYAPDRYRIETHSRKGESGTGYIIARDGFSYSWMVFDKGGILKKSDGSEGIKKAVTKDNDPADYYEYRNIIGGWQESECTIWTDDSVFDIPNLTFKTVAAQ